MVFESSDVRQMGFKHVYRFVFAFYLHFIDEAEMSSFHIGLSFRGPPKCRCHKIFVKPSRREPKFTASPNTVYARRKLETHVAYVHRPGVEPNADLDFWVAQCFDFWVEFFNNVEHIQRSLQCVFRVLGVV